MTQERKKSIITILILLLFSSLIVSACSSGPPVPQGEISETDLKLIDIDGFPPEVPHELEGRGDCLVCHRDGEIGGVPKTPHPEFTTCRQCHVLTDALN